jgi:uncharacterized protein (TIGR03382 family)
MTIPGTPRFVCPARRVCASIERMRSAVAVALLTVASSTAAAHAVLTYPPPRSTTEIKDYPCGALNSTRGANVTTLAPGSTLTVQFKETIEHPGHYRISFDLDGQDFVTPPDATSSTEGMTNVVKDLIPDVTGTIPVGGRPYTVDIALPNMQCTNCTLQLIQMMTDKPPYTANADPAGADDIYYSCADIILATNAPDAGTQVTPPDASIEDPGSNGRPPSSESGGCSAGGSGAGLSSALALLGFAGWRRRRRRS